MAGELLLLPESAWRANLVGHNAAACLGTVMTMGAAPLAALLVALRRGAPESPTRAGALAGLTRGALAATLYACTAPTTARFLWAPGTPLAIGGLTLVGALAGSRVLRW